jgi:elongation factor Ts
MAIAIEDIKNLREKTGAGMMKAKEALEASGGDFEKAVQWLREKGEASAAKKADREAREGLIEGYVHSGRIGVLVEVNRPAPRTLRRSRATWRCTLPPPTLST